MINLFRKISLLSFSFSFLITLPVGLMAQGEVPVNMYTGTPGIFVKLYTLTDYDLSETIALTYNTNALRLNTPRTYGVGWGMDGVGGQINREVRGLPDDYAAASPDARKGWLYNNNSTNASSFNSTSDQSAATCDEQADNSFFTNLNYNMDTEPDLFSFSVGGVSGQFVFTNNRAISLIPYQDIKIVPTFKYANSDFTIIDSSKPDPYTITGWTITTNDGKVYSFLVSEACAASKGLMKNNDVSISLKEYFQYPNESYAHTLNVLGGTYNMPVQSRLSYNASWMLSDVKSPTGASLTYTYTTTPTGSSSWRVFSIFKPGAYLSRESLYLMMENTTYTEKVLLSIATSGSRKKVTFTGYDDIAISDYDRSNTPFKHFRMAYTSGFLTSVTETDDSNCTQMPPYKFYYNNMYAYPATSGSTRQDFWGFYNGAANSLTSYTPTIYCYPNEPASERYRIYPIPNYAGTQVTLTGSGNRLPNADAILTGTLSRIVYPTGGETDLTFEPHQYYDAKAAKDQLGGGLRLKSALYYDGVNPSANIVKNFTYTDISSHSSGRMIVMPVFAMPLYKFYNGTTALSYSTLASQGTTNLWNGITAVSQTDMNTSETTSGSTVGYTRVTVARPGSGKVVFDYTMPAAYGDAATGNGSTDWSPTVMKFARPGSCPSMNQIPGAETWGYPAFNNTYYDYERGLLSKESEYNEAGTLVRTTQPTYQYIFKPGASTPTTTIGIAYDVFANSDVPTFLFGRYSMLGDVAKVTATETVTTYDENNASRFAAEATQYEYTSAYHRLMNRVTQTTTDGTVYRNTMKYTLDYPVTTTKPADSTLLMIWWLKDSNRSSTVIEQYTTMTPPGGTEKTTGASLVKFRAYKSYTTARPLLKFKLAFRPSAPVTDFVPSFVNGSYAFQNDARYDIVNTIHEYDTLDRPLSSTGEDKVTKGTLWGYRQRFPVAQFTQARSTSIAFSDFDATTAVNPFISSFTATNEYYGAGRTGVKGIHPYATLTRNGITKPANASSYLLSFWVKPKASTASITLAVTLSYGSTSLPTKYYTFTYDTASTDYQYFKQLIDVSALNTSAFNIQINGYNFANPGGGYFTSGLTPLLDDVAFYPSYATLSSTAYDIPFGPNAVTDASGMTMFTSYDGLGRAKLITDQSHNIRQRFSYVANGQILPTTIVAQVTGIVGKYETGTPIQFVAKPMNCVTGATYEWDFGSGYSTPSSSNTSAAQTYATSGSRTLTLRVSHPVYGQSVTSFSYYVYPPLSVTLCPTGVKQIDNMIVTQSYSCFTNPNPSNWITVKANLSNDESSVTYQWQEQRVGLPDWSSVPNNNTSQYARLVLWREGNFLIKCTVTTTDGRVIDSSTVLVTINVPQ